MPRGPKDVKKSKVHKGLADYYLRREMAAKSAMEEMSLSEAGRKFGLSKPTVRYWTDKRKNGDFKRNTHGGKRYENFSLIDKCWLRELAIKAPKTRLNSFRKALIELTGTNVTTATISRYFDNLGWSYHNEEHKQKLKYTKENIERYFNHVLAMPDIIAEVSMKKVKYLDEVHYVTKTLHKQKGIGPRGKRIVLPVDCDLSESYSMTLLTNPNDEKIPYAANLRKGSNTQYDFCLFVCHCIRGGYLEEGDVLIMDNASVHVGTDTFLYHGHSSKSKYKIDISTGL